MRFLRKTYRRLRALVWKSRIEHDMDEELRLHLQMRTEDNLASGMPVEAARLDAVRRFGNMTRIKEQGRDIRGGGFMEILIQDIRYGFRTLWKNPGFTLAAVLTLALGIGANTAIFSWVKALTIDYMPGVDRPEDLVAMPGMNRDGTGCCTGVSHPDLLDYMSRNPVLDGMLGYEFINVNLRTQNDAVRVQGTIVTGNYFDVLRAKPFLGRTFQPEETRTPGTHPVAVISHRLWQRSFGADPAIVNREVSVNGRSFTIIGVMPAEFGSAMIGLAFDIFIPVTMQSVVAPGSNMLGNRGAMWLDVLGRLKPGVSVERARDEIALVSRQIEADHPDTGKDRTLGVFPLLESPLGVLDAIFSVVMVLAAVVGLVLLVACANVSNLLLARAAARQKETAVRLALGAGRARLIRQLLTESLILALLAGVAGLAIGSWTLRGMTTLIPDMDVPISFNTRMDANVLAFTLGISLLTGVIFGLAPAVRLSKGRNQTGRQRLRNSLVVAQIAFSVIALIAAGLFLRSLQSAYSTNLGFNPDTVLMVSLDVFPNGYSSERGRQFYAQLLDDVRRLPGVRAATLARRPPLTQRGARLTGLSEIEGYQPGPDEKLQFIYDTVGTDFFETMQIPLLRGRGFTTEHRAGAPQVVIVNESFAQRYWPNQDAVGKRLRRGNAWIEVIGLAKDVKTRRITDSGLPFMYTSHQQVYEPDMTLIVRADDAISLAEPVRRVVRELDKDLALFAMMPMSAHVGTALSAQRAAASGTTVFALLALMLATIGVYGMASYSVSQRTHEIGIRMALGAQRRDVYRLILGQGGRSILLGLGIGLAASALLTRYMATLLFGVQSGDPVTFVGISVLLSAFALLACYLPARRATRVDPVTALRHD